MKFSHFPFLLTSGLLLSQAACHRSGGGNNNSGIIDPNTLVPKEAWEELVPVSRDTSCTALNAVSLTDAWIHELANGNIEQQKITVTSPLKGNPSLTSAFINKTDFHHYFMMQCTDSSCDRSDINSAKAGEELPICDPAGQYNRGTAEDIALTSATAIEKANNFYNSINIQKPALPQVALAIQPFLLILDHDDNKYYPMTDNLTFAPKMGNLGPAISVYPKSKDGDKIWPTMNLWESSWVLSHELSHGIFSAFIQKYIDNSSLTALLNRSFMPIINLDVKTGEYREFPGTHGATSFNLAGNTFDRDMSFLVTGVNEGFADLFGHLAMNDPSGSYIKGFNCFEETRSVVARIAADGAEKVFSTNAIGRFDSRSDYPKSGSGSNCQRTIFADAHTLGAFFAYTYNQTFEAFGVTDASEKGGLLLNWLPKLFTTLDAVYKAEPTMAVMLSNVAYSFVDYVATSKELTPAACTQLKALYPGFMTNWAKTTRFSNANCR